MTKDETLEISREKLFKILSQSFTDITGECIEILEKGDRELFVSKIEKLIDSLNHDILYNSKREKPLKEEGTRVELGWS